MLLMAPPVLEALDAVGAGRPRPGLLRVLLAPDGARFDQTTAVGWARELDHLVLVCGRYEGIDERVRRHVDKVVSLGDFVLMGGEAAAWAIAEAVLRLIPGVVEERSLSEESFCEGLLEGPQYTRPPYRVTRNTETTEPDLVQDDAPRKVGGDADMLGAWSDRLVEAVPEILRSGDHGRVARAKRRAALARTLIARPDLLREALLGEVDAALMGEVVVTVGRTVGSGRGEDTADRAASTSSDDWVERMLY